MQFLKRNALCWSRLSSTFSTALACALLVLAMCRGAVAQTFSASISGIVTDPAGAAVSGVNVHLENMDTHDKRDFVSTADGVYKFDNLLPGTYQITAEAAGFKTHSQSNMILRANTAASVNIPLEIGTAQQKVDVTGETVLIDTQTANSSVSLDSALIQALPNSTRSPLNFVFSLAGTTEAQGGMTSRSQTFDQNFSMFGVNGGRSGAATILIDGAPSTAMDWGGLIVSPINDSVQEQQVVTNNYDAQYERAGMGVVTLITKGGSNNFHGEVYDFFRNSALDANRWANNEFDLPKNQLKRNQFGGNIGGPISKRHNLYFFAAYDALRQHDSENSGLQTVPTQLERNGDFSQSFNTNGDPLVIYNPFSTAQVTDAAGSTYYTRAPFGGNIIPASLINPTGQKYADLFPLPNQPSQGPNDFNNFLAQGPGVIQNDKFEWRVDWAQNEKNRIFVRMSDRVRQLQTPPCFFCNGADNNSANDDTGFQVVINDTFTPSPTWVINAYVSYGRWHEAQNPIALGQADASTVGLDPSLFQSANALPNVTMDQYTSIGAQPYNYNRYVRYNETAQVNLTKQLSNHTIRFGGNFDILLINNEQFGMGNVSTGSYLTACDAGPAGGPCQAPATASTTSGNGIASLLLGTGDVSSTFNPLPAMSQHAFGFYVQDQWRVTNRLTLNFGLRYENQRPATERYNQIAWFDPTVVNPISAQLGYQVLGGFEYADKDHRYAWTPNNKDFAPRVGLAYKATDKLVLRAGAGLFYTPSSAMLSFDFPGQFLGYGSNTTSYGTQDALGLVPTTPISSPFPTGLNPQTGNSQGLNTYVGLDAGQIWLKGSHPDGYTEQWSFNMQYQLSSHSVFEVGYTGVNGRKLMYGNPNININQLPAQYLGLGDSYLQTQVPNPFAGVITNPNSSLSGDTIYQYQLLQPYPQFGALTVNRSLPGARSNYHALDVRYNHAFSNGLSAVVSYRWSKALDNASEDFVGWAIGNLWRDSYNTMLDYAVSTHDQPHSFAVAAVYDLPYGAGKKWGSGGPWLAKQVLGNWQLSTNIRVASGLPIFGIINDYNAPLSNLYGFPSPQTPDLVGNPVPSHQTPDQWINPNAFALTDGQSRLGTSPLRIPTVREAPTEIVDLSVAKSFGPERFRVQFRGDFLNLFNHPVFGGNYNFNTCLNCGGVFGQVYDTRNDPRNIQFGLKAMF